MFNKSEWNWTVVYQDPKGRTIYEHYRLKSTATREAKRTGGKVYPFGKGEADV